MGHSTNAAHLASKIHALSVAIPTAGAAGLLKAAKLVEASVGVASGKYRGHAITEVNSSVGGRGEESVAFVRMTSRKAHLLDHDTHFPHTSRSLTSSTAFAPRDGVRTHGKFMWERGVAASRAGVLATMARSLGETVGKVFG